jgi:hypothetical protein
MPRGDRSGPQGKGPMKGRSAGFCAGFEAPGFMNRAIGFGRRAFGFGRGGMGFGSGRGRGMGWRNAWDSSAGGPGCWGPPGPFFAGPGWGSPWGPAPGASSDPDAELGALREESAALKDALEGVRERIEELEAERKKSENRG